MIKINEICKKYDEKVLFQNYSLEIPDGSFVIIRGDSGSGKSTLLNMIGGIEYPDSGSIIVNGFDVSKKKKQKYFSEVVGFLFQNFALLENKTVLENLNLIKKTGRTGVSIDEALKKVGLEKEKNKKVYKLSGGEQQRVALARLMIKKCSVLLADEPTGSLDKKNSEIVMKILHDLNRQGKTVIVVTHDDDIIEKEDMVIYLS
ncbi:ATP-binding cassette domain-containing protein [Lagierella sp. ICN-221743]